MKTFLNSLKVIGLLTLIFAILAFSFLAKAAELKFLLWMIGK